VVKVTLAVALEATMRAGANPEYMPCVFSSSGSDGHICHEICQALASPAREVSPTRFANSVHNVAAGYWSIATGSMSESNVLCAFDASFVAGLLDSILMVAVDRQTVLFVAYDTEYPPPLHAKRPIPDALGVAMILSPERTANSMAGIEIALTDESADKMTDPGLEALRSQVPAARSLPLLRLLAGGGGGRVVLDYLDVSRAAVQVQPCI
jgi:Beta-ketoacyl synthase, N-terminal domain